VLKCLIFNLLSISKMEKYQALMGAYAMPGGTNNVLHSQHFANLGKAVRENDERKP